MTTQGTATNAPRPAVDPVTLEVVRSGIYAIAEEMRVIVMRSARSPLLKEAGDLSCVLTDAQGRLIAQGSKDNLMHLGTMSFTVTEFLKRIPAETLRDGDVFFCNSPAVGGNHLPDVKAIRPIFYRDHLVAFAVNLSHWPDVGGALPGSYVPWATELYQEGLHITPFRLFDKDGPIGPSLELVLANLRGRAERQGDIYAQRASADVAAERLVELFDRYGLETVLACFERFMDESEQLMRDALRALPDGVYEGVDYMDNDGLGHGPVKLAVKVTIDGDRAVFDWSETDPQVPGPVNTTYFITCAAVYYACKALLGPQIPPNAGYYRPLEVIVPRGRFVNASEEAAVVGGNHETSQRLADTLFQAFARVLPERVVCAGSGSAGIGIISGHWDDGGRFVYYEVHGGGAGAGQGFDGASAIRVHMSNVMNTPTEIIEAEYPMRIERHEVRVGSSGAGRWRGGMGVRRTYRLLCERGRLTTMIERCVVPPWGLFGGEPGKCAEISLEREGQVRSVTGKESIELQRGDQVTIQTSGAGGYGPAAERSAELLERDRLEGYSA